MSVNVPTTTPDRVDFGPAVVFLGLAGATPVTDVGAIGEDGVQFEQTTDQIEVSQGNPKITDIVFNQAQAAMVKFRGLEWDFNRYVYALAGGATASGVGYTQLTFGGDPCPDEVAIQLQHEMCRTGDSIVVNIWRAVGDGNITFNFDLEVMGQDMNFKVLKAATDWAGNPLGGDEQLWKMLWNT